MPTSHIIIGKRAIVIVRQKRGEPYLDLDAAIRQQGYRAELRRTAKSDEGGQTRLWFEIVWRRPIITDLPPDLRGAPLSGPLSASPADGLPHRFQFRNGAV